MILHDPTVLSDLVRVAAFSLTPAIFISFWLRRGGRYPKTGVFFLCILVGALFRYL
jgi:hypothetical protein